MAGAVAIEEKDAATLANDLGRFVFLKQYNLALEEAKITLKISPPKDAKKSRDVAAASSSDTRQPGQYGLRPRRVRHLTHEPASSSSDSGVESVEDSSSARDLKLISKGPSRNTYHMKYRSQRRQKQVGNIALSCVLCVCKIIYIYIYILGSTYILAPFFHPPAQDVCLLQNVPAAWFPILGCAGEKCQGVDRVQPPSNSAP